MGRKLPGNISGGRARAGKYAAAHRASRRGAPRYDDGRGGASSHSQAVCASTSAGASAGRPSRVRVSSRISPSEKEKFSAEPLPLPTGYGCAVAIADVRSGPRGAKPDRIRKSRLPPARPETQPRRRRSAHRSRHDRCGSGPRTSPRLRPSGETQGPFALTDSRPAVDAHRSSRERRVLRTRVSRPQMGRQDRRRAMRAGHKRSQDAVSVSGAAPIRPNRVRPREPIPQRETTSGETSLPPMSAPVFRHNGPSTHGSGFGRRDRSG